MTATLEKLVDSLAELPRTLRERFLVWEETDEGCKDLLAENVEWLLNSVQQELICSGRSSLEVQDLLPRVLIAFGQLVELKAEIENKLGFQLCLEIPVETTSTAVSVTDTAKLARAFCVTFAESAPNADAERPSYGFGLLMAA